jgi:hypothetical protein
VTFAKVTTVIITVLINPKPTLYFEPIIQMENTGRKENINTTALQTNQSVKSCNYKAKELSYHLESLRNNQNENCSK